MLNRRKLLTGALAGGPALIGLGRAEGNTQAKDDGYRGIWYFNQPSKDKYVYKYSGGFATYPQQHAPIAIYSKEAHKTFFCYGGSLKSKPELLHMVSYFDHKTGTVPRPTILLNKHTDDAHDNPTLSIDDDGYLWIFSSSHGTSRPSYIHRGSKPYSIDRFERVLESNFSYTQPWFVPHKGFLFLHTRYRPLGGGRSASGRALYSMSSLDGFSWTKPRELAFTGQGHYQISWPNPSRSRLGTAFDFHPDPGGLNQRTNLHFMQTANAGLTWETVDGRSLLLPVATEDNAALVRDYRKEGLLVYLKDLQYDAADRPILLYLTSKGYEPGPENGPRHLMLARWTGSEWHFSTVAETDHNYDHGSLYLEKDVWRIIVPTGAGPQPWSTGGEVENWESRDQGQTWKRTGALTAKSERNHTYVRRPLGAHPDFYALWADGDALKPSSSCLYFANQRGHVFRLPALMKGRMAKPELVGA
ncbi:BNR-4 repeat-containing protein [uncultured Paludibaculum sp.]|uniref:BNR-4 repeat-containing protein n=1 Tax=uncultured Paludibaculum sp. TaxID=1765020 RepID=UPI002AAA8623|nr:BNR-4 repeat-containing protein [uncultured Paludibaculum sp.]